MFKHISEILSKLSVGQRLLALVFLLLSITFISVGPKIIDSLTHDTEELKVKVKNQRSEIQTLTQRVTQLNDQVIEGQMACTDKFVTREKEIMDLLSDLESLAKSENGKVLSTQTVYERMEQRPRYVEEPEDFNQPSVARMEMQSPPKEKTIVIKTDNTNMLKMICKAKKNVKDHMGK